MKKLLLIIASLGVFSYSNAQDGNSKKVEPSKKTTETAKPNKNVRFQALKNKPVEKKSAVATDIDNK